MLSVRSLVSDEILSFTDYIFALKANHPQLHQDVIDWFDWAHKRDFRDVKHSFHQTVNKGHGRLEIRRCWAIADPLALESLGYYEGWAGLQTVVMVQREQRLANKTQTETVYYVVKDKISSDTSDLTDSIQPEVGVVGDV
jgi:hypothetical protein